MNGSGECAASREGTPPAVANPCRGPLPPPGARRKGVLLRRFAPNGLAASVTERLWTNDWLRARALGDAAWQTMRVWEHESVEAAVSRILVVPHSSRRA